MCRFWQKSQYRSISAHRGVMGSNRFDRSHKSILLMAWHCRWRQESQIYSSHGLAIPIAPGSAKSEQGRGIYCPHGLALTMALGVANLLFSWLGITDCVKVGEVRARGVYYPHSLALPMASGVANIFFSWLGITECRQGRRSRSKKRARCRGLKTYTSASLVISGSTGPWSQVISQREALQILGSQDHLTGA